MKKYLSVPIKCIILLIAFSLCGMLVLWFSFMLPVNPMKENLKYSKLAVAQNDGTSGELLFGDPSSFAGSFTDEIMIQNAIYKGNHNSLESSMGVYRSDADADNWQPAEALIKYLEGNPFENELSYSRYWHGYLVFLKPLLLLFSIEEIKILNMILLSALWIGIFLIMERKGLRSLIPGFFAASVFMMPPAMILSLSLSICAYISLSAMLVLLLLEKIKEENILVFFFAVGMITSYFDFLTFPLVTLGFPLILFAALREKNEKKVRNLFFSAISSMLWGIGYLSMWMMKWVLGSIILKQSIFADALETIKKRTSSGIDSNRLKFFFEALYRNLYSWKALPYIFLMAVVLIFVIIGIIRLVKKEKSALISHVIPNLFISALPLIWTFIAVNHTFEHRAFTYRIFAISVMAVITASLNPGKSKSKGSCC